MLNSTRVYSDTKGVEKIKTQNVSDDDQYKKYMMIQNLVTIYCLRHDKNSEACLHNAIIISEFYHSLYRNRMYDVISLF